MTENKTKDFFFTIVQKVYLLGSSNYWSEDLKLPKFIYKIHDSLSFLKHFIIILFICSEWLALFTQHNLSDKQKSDLILFSFSQPFLQSYSIALSLHKDKIREVLQQLTITLKSSFNDREVERQMIRRATVYTTGFTFLISFALFSYGANALLNVIVNGGTFTTVITAWPDVEHRSFMAGVVRILSYIAWWLFAIRLCCVYWIIIPMTVLLSHQFKNLNSYFCSLSQIFEGNESQADKERKYEEDFKLGIQWHADTLRCTGLCQDVFYYVYSGQILLNISVLSALMLQFLTSERTFLNAIANFATISAMMMSTGCLMWNAGDVTVEASTLSTAMFESGWHNCTAQTSRRIKSVVVIAMWQSQKLVELRCLGVLTMSYQSYLSIVKTSYSVVSVLY